MKKMTAVEMRNLNGGIGLITAAAALLGGGYVGVYLRVNYEHLRYGKCRTYPKWCKKCR